MSRNVCISAAEGQTGFAIAELLLSPPFSRKVDSVTALIIDSSSNKVQELKSLGANVVAYVPGSERDVVQTLKQTGCDTICLIPPARADKLDVAAELINASKKAGLVNLCLISSTGCDYADRQKQPRLREFIELETLALAAKGDPETSLGHSPVIIRLV